MGFPGTVKVVTKFTVTKHMKCEFEDEALRI